MTVLIVLLFALSFVVGFIVGKVFVFFAEKVLPKPFDIMAIVAMLILCVYVVVSSIM